MAAHPGAFCSPPGGVDETNTGTSMVCSVAKQGDRARWRRNGPKPASRPRRARRARGGAADNPLPQVDAGINPTRTEHAVPEAADAAAQKDELRNTPHESDRTGPDAVCTRCNLPAVNPVHTNSARHPEFLAHKDLVQRAGGPKRPDETMEQYDNRLAPHRADDDPAKPAAEKMPLTDQEVADKMRDAYRAQPDKWMAMKDLAATTGLTPEEIDRGTRELMKDDNFRAEPEAFGHRVQDEDRRVAPVIGKEPRHKLAFMDRVTAVPGETTPAAPVAAPAQPQPVAAPIADTPAPARPVDGHYTEKAPKPNNWGGIPNSDVHTLHYDGALPRGVESLGQDAQIDMGGEPLADTILDLGDQVRSGRLHPSELPERLAAVRDRLPKDSRAYRTVSYMADAVDAPMTDVPYVPEGTPEPLRNLVTELHRIPIVRQRPERELGPVADLAKRLAAGEIRDRDVESALYGMNRHEMESDSGSMQINKLVESTRKTLEKDRMDARRRRQAQQGQ